MACSAAHHQTGSKSNKIVEVKIELSLALLHQCEADKHRRHESSATHAAAVTCTGPTVNVTAHHSGQSGPAAMQMTAASVSTSNRWPPLGSGTMVIPGRAMHSWNEEPVRRS